MISFRLRAGILRRICDENRTIEETLALTEKSFGYCFEIVVTYPSFRRLTDIWYLKGGIIYEKEKDSGKDLLDH